MKLFIPTIGVSLKLTSPATVKVYFESRNNQFLNRLGVYYPRLAYNPYTRKDYYVAGRQIPALSTSEKAIQKKYGVVLSGIEFCTLTLPAGSELTVSRIYLRKGVSDYDSVTFSLKKAGKDSVYGRFWIKLEDVNTLEVEVSRSVEDVKQAKIDRKKKQIEKELRKKQSLIDQIVILKLEILKQLNQPPVYNPDNLKNRSDTDLEYLKRQLENQLQTWLSRNQIKELLKGV